MSIYVEIAIRASLDDVWRATQVPDEHARWDLRFTEIRYLPRDDDTQPQRFLHATRIGFGFGIAGEGESVGTRDDRAGARASALRFWPDDPRSLILEGSGYWKYVPPARGVTWRRSTSAPSGPSSRSSIRRSSDGSGSRAVPHRRERLQSHVGPLFGYRGTFDVAWKTVGAGEVPADVLPMREEPRE